ncbi:MAG: YecA family protein [Oceanospirillaceae bacterium]
MQAQQQNTAITDSELDALENFIFSDAVSEESLDLIGIHGFLCALVISPNPVDEATWMEIIFDGQPSWANEQQQTEIGTVLSNWHASIRTDMENDRELEMPCDLTLVVEDEEEVADVETWAQAFMEGVFLKEEGWHGKGADQEQKVTELMLPIMVISDLFDAKEFREIRKNPDVCEEMANEIPDILIDLYLIFQTPEK